MSIAARFGTLADYERRDASIITMGGHVDVESGISHRDPAKLWGVPLRMSDKDHVYFLVSGAILSYLGASPAPALLRIE